MAELTWGRRFAMCAPTYFGVEYSINPWMDPARRVDAERATAQWEALHDTLKHAGAEIALIEPRPGVPDLVFTANAALIDGRDAMLATFRHAERQAERPIAAGFLADQGFAVHELPPGRVQEGAGDALPFGNSLVAGFGWRSSREGYDSIAARGISVVPVQLVDARLYHLDITFCPIDDRRALIAPSGLSRASIRELTRLVPEPIVLSDDDALRFAANSVVVGKNIVMPYVPVAAGRTLERLGFTVAECEMSEFTKAGGACRCLTLALDTTLPSTTVSTAA